MSPQTLISTQKGKIKEHHRLRKEPEATTMHTLAKMSHTKPVKYYRSRQG